MLLVLGVGLFLFGIPGGFEVLWVWVGMLSFVVGAVLVARRAVQRDRNADG